jgi:hypothetical protein
MNPTAQQQVQTMVDDKKHSEAVKTWFTERELVDLTRMAVREDRKLSELIRVIVRRHMYGHVAPISEDFHGSNSPDEGRGL